jgi:hypothetical protein
MLAACCTVFTVKSLGRLDDDKALATDPHDDRSPVFAVMTPTGFALLATPMRAAPERFLPTLFRLPLVPSRVWVLIYVVRIEQM